MQNLSMSKCVVREGLKRLYIAPSVQKREKEINNICINYISAPHPPLPPGFENLTTTLGRYL